LVRLNGEGDVRRLVLLISVFLLAVAAQADSRIISLINQSGDTILTASLVQDGEDGEGGEGGEDPPVNPIALSSAAADGDTGDMTVNLPDGQCVVDLTYQRANGDTQTQRNVDLCSIDAIVVE
jgi:hypothetical protein